MCKRNGPINVIGETTVTQNRYYDGGIDVTISFARDLQSALIKLARVQYPELTAAEGIAKLVKTWVEDQADLDLNE